jgi:hypothetical protein
MHHFGLLQFRWVLKITVIPGSDEGAWSGIYYLLVAKTKRKANGFPF